MKTYFRNFAIVVETRGQGCNQLNQLMISFAFQPTMAHVILPTHGRFVIISNKKHIVNKQQVNLGQNYSLSWGGRDCVLLD
jgi:hypothetical protein